MGCGPSSTSKNNESTDSTVNAVDVQLAEAAANERNHFKVLLLGAGESGKSTFSKQLKLINKGTISDKEKLMYRKAIRQNLVECMQTLLDAAEAMKVPLEYTDIKVPIYWAVPGGACATMGTYLCGGPVLQIVRSTTSCPVAQPVERDSSLRKASVRIQNVNLVSGDVDKSVGDDVARLWADAGIQDTWAKKDKFWILDSTPYYMRECHRISGDNYEPTEEDVLMTRVITTGVGTIEVKEPPYRFSVVDVGGQRNERKKWLHCFDDVKAVVFFISLAGYNQVMFEDSNQNRLLESLDLYEQVVSNPIFRNTPIHVMLNKMDLFEEMIKVVPLSTCFPEYRGPPEEVLSAISFIEGACRDILAKCCPQKHCTITPICARVREDVKVTELFWYPQVGWKEVADAIRHRYAAETMKR